jgi:hypothetical protein
MAATTDEQTYSYVRPSELTFGGDRADPLVVACRCESGPGSCQEAR